MDLNLLIPGFLALLVAELALGRIRGSAPISFRTTFSNLGAGLLSVSTGSATRAVRVGVYGLVFEYARLFELDAGALWVWGVGIVAYDFHYYVYHRLSHRIPLLWAAHAVHHQSEEFNLSAALRVPSMSFLFNWMFYVPMAVVGIPVEVFLAASAIDLAYQFWVHTEQIGRLGPMEWVFVTPSNHRVHHGRNPQYLDRNFGGIFIVWDRLLGSFREEREKAPIEYGVDSTISTMDPVWANIGPFVALAKEGFETRSVRGAVSTLFVRQQPPGGQGGCSKVEPVTSTSAGMQLYAGLQGVSLIIAGLWVTGASPAAPDVEMLAWFFMLAVGLVSLNRLLEGRGHWLEAARLLATAAFAVWTMPASIAVLVSVGVAISLAVLVQGKIGSSSLYLNGHLAGRVDTPEAASSR